MPLHNQNMTTPLDMKMATAEQVTEEEMFRAGEEHARSGKMCTPFDCQAIDKVLFAAMTAHPHPGAWYATMRGAFNRGWQSGYVRSIGSGLGGTAEPTPGGLDLAASAAGAAQGSQGACTVVVGQDVRVHINSEIGALPARIVRDVSDDACARRTANAMDGEGVFVVDG